MKNAFKIVNISLLLLLMILIISCKTRDLNYITYYNQVNVIDSIYRIQNDTLQAQKLYSKLFKKYAPHQAELIEEYETYIRISDKYKKNFGGKKALSKLIPLVAPYWKYKRQDAEFFKFYKKYGIDSLPVENKVAVWKSKLNKSLVDSFAVARLRDQEKSRTDSRVMLVNDEKNAKLLVWTFENFGYPSLKKIGLWGNNNEFMTMSTLLTHMAGEEQYPYFKAKLLEYVKSGDCPPENYATMIDKYCFMHNLNLEYGGTFESSYKKIDSAQADRNRKLIGLPSLKHRSKIQYDYFND